MLVQSCCFANQTYCFFDVLAAAAVFIAKAPSGREVKSKKMFYKTLKLSFYFSIL